MIGNCKQNRTSICWFTLVFLLSVFGCKEDRVPIPKPELDKPPVISVKAVASGGSGQIQYPDASPSTCASPCKNPVTLPNQNATADIVLVINASNPGGVKYLNVVVSQNGPLYEVSTSDAPDANNLVAASLSILGTNNAGGIGGNPLLIHLNKVKTNATVLVTAGNHNGQTSLYAVTYYMKNHVTANLSVSKSTIYTDEKTKLTWTTTNAESTAITPTLQNPPQPYPPLKVNGNAEEGPFPQPGSYTYTLTARDWLEAATSSKTVMVTKRPKVGGDIKLLLNFTCPNAGEQIFATATFVGICDGANCVASNPSSVGGFTVPYTQNVICSNANAGFGTISPPNLQSGHWKVTVTPAIVPVALVDPAECSVQVKAGEHRSVLFDYVRDPQTLRWSMTCRTN